MADILIRGMEMPENCFECWVPCTVPFEDRCHLSRADSCPIIAMPKGHGRLIDKGRLCNEILNSKDKPEICDGAEEVLWIERCISIAPTVIPAEKEADHAL